MFLLFCCISKNNLMLLTFVIEMTKFLLVKFNGLKFWVFFFLFVFLTMASCNTYAPRWKIILASVFNHPWYRASTVSFRQIVDILKVNVCSVINFCTFPCWIAPCGLYYFVSDCGFFFLQQQGWDLFTPCIEKNWWPFNLHKTMWVLH